MVSIKEASIKDFKYKMRKYTKRCLTKNLFDVVNKLNPIIRGKINYYRTIENAKRLNEEKGQESNCVTLPIAQAIDILDRYTRQRIRLVSIAKHPTMKKVMALYNKFSLKVIYLIFKLVCGYQYYYLNYKIEKYIEDKDKKNKKNLEAQIKREKEKGKEYYTKERLQKMKISFSKCYY